MARNPQDLTATGVPTDLRTGQPLQQDQKTAAPSTVKVVPVEEEKLSDINEETSPDTKTDTSFTARIQEMMKNPGNVSLANINQVVAGVYTEALKDGTPESIREEMKALKEKAASDPKASADQKEFTNFVADTVIGASEVAGTDADKFGGEFVSRAMKNTSLLARGFGGGLAGVAGSASSESSPANGMAGFLQQFNFADMGSMGGFMGMIMMCLAMVMGIENPALLAQLTGQPAPGNKPLEQVSLEDVKKSPLAELKPEDKTTLEKLYVEGESYRKPDEPVQYNFQNGDSYLISKNEKGEVEIRDVTGKDVLNFEGDKAMMKANHHGWNPSSRVAMRPAENVEAAETAGQDPAKQESAQHAEVKPENGTPKIVKGDVGESDKLVVGGIPVGKYFSKMVDGYVDALKNPGPSPQQTASVEQDIVNDQKVKYTGPIF